MTSKRQYFGEFIINKDQNTSNGLEYKLTEQEKNKAKNISLNKKILNKLNNRNSENENLDNYLPNSIKTDLNKELKEEINQSKHNLKNNQNYFFHDYDDDIDDENDDNQRLIINTINNLNSLDDSNSYEQINFKILNDEVKKFFLNYLFNRIIFKYLYSLKIL